jgi:DNA-binding response OmpR family regulator
MAIPVEPARIFVADTDSSIVELMQDLLQDDGYSVTVLQCATNAYEEIRQTLSDLVILDITLERPGDGWLTFDQLRHHAQTSQVPVIICTADVRELRARQDDLAGLGCVAVEKPFDIDTLLTAIREGLAVKRQVKTLTAQHKETYRDLHVPDGAGASVPGSVGIARTQAPQGVQSGSVGGSEAWRHGSNSPLSSSPVLHLGTWR